MDRNTGMKPFKCPQCDADFAQKEDLLQHVMSHAGAKSYSCKECGAAFVCESHLNCHVRIHSGEKLYSCTLCSASFTEQDNLSSHAALHTAKKSIQCSDCGIVFGEKDDLAKHEDSKPCKTAHACPYCGLYYLEKESLDKHILSHHPSDNSSVKQFTCKDCESQFSHQCLLQRHVLVHTQKVLNQCDNCGASFSESSELALHNLTHCEDLLHTEECNDTSPKVDSNTHVTDDEEVHCVVKCATCGSSFKCIGDLDEHKLTHVMEKFCNGEPHTAIVIKEESPDYAAVACVQSMQIGSRCNNVTCNDAPYTHAEHTNTNEDVESICGELVHRTTPHSCDICGATFSALSILYDHRRTHASDESVECPHCKAVFISQSKLDEHLPVHFSETPFSCRDCGINFTHINELNDHLRSQHPIDALCSPAGLCIATLDESSSTRKRPLTHFNVKPHKCEECTASFSSKRELWDHIPVHSCEMTYTCQNCGIAFAELVSLTRHIQTHHPTKKEDRPSCDFGTAVASMFKRPGVLMPYQCEHCGCEFLQESELIDHIHVHTSEMTYACQDCGITFADVNGLNSHIVCRHPGDKIYNVRDRSSVNRHVKVEGASPILHVPRPFKCEICDSEFTRKTHLTRHALIHTGEKPYKCDECGVSFGRKSHLQRHSFIHTGLKPFKCDQCGMAFGRKSHLKRHSQKHPESFSKTLSSSPKRESSPVYSVLTTRTNPSVAFPGMPPTSSQYPTTSPLKQALERDINYTSPPFSSNVSLPMDSSQNHASHPHWNLFQPMLSFNVHEALNWSRQNDAHSAYPNLKNHQNPVA